MGQTHMQFNFLVCYARLLSEQRIFGISRLLYFQKYFGVKTWHVSCLKSHL